MEEELKELFGENALSYDDFSKAVEEKGMKLANLSAGGYVAKSKYDDDVKKAKNLDYKKKYEDLEASIQGDDGINAKLKNITTERDDYKSKYEDINSKYSMLEATNKVIRAGIKPEFAKFVASEVLGQETDTIDFDTALKTYKAKNPQFNTEATIVRKKVGSSLSLDGKEQTNQEETNKTMNDLIRSVRD
jgi:hypothetical protein